MTSFDPDYPNMALDEFRPLILSVLRRIPYSLPGLPNDEASNAKKQIVAISESRYNENE